MARRTSAPPADLEKVVRQFVRFPTRPERSNVYFNGGTNSNGATQDTEGEDIPTLEWSASCGTEVTTLEARGYTLTLSNDDEDPDVFQIEDFRITHEERIFGDDGESFVDIEVIDQIDFRNKAELVRKFSLSN